MKNQPDNRFAISLLFWPRLRRTAKQKDSGKHEPAEYHYRGREYRQELELKLHTKFILNFNSSTAANYLAILRRRLPVFLIAFVNLTSP
ncbi:MAG: hypothetical protein H0T77_00120 [Pyrinomonadaceae bacterium]|nr:hypothetical protein [Pyrinomonadaceae bacterium]